MKDRHGNDVKPGDRVRLCGDKGAVCDGSIGRVAEFHDARALIEGWKGDIWGWSFWATSAEIELVTEEAR